MCVPVCFLCCFFFICLFVGMWTTGEDFEGYWARRAEASAASQEAERAGGCGCASGGMRLMRYAKPGKNIQIYFMSLKARGGECRTNHIVHAKEMRTSDHT